jgi:hypothetical protein
MKIKTLTLSALAALAMTFTANAQDESSESMKFAAGDRNLEVQLAPLGGNPISINGIRYRSFMSASTAWRVNAFLGFSSSSTITQQEDADNDLLELKDSETSFTLNLRPGYEMHFGGTKRLSPYVGGELDLGYMTSASRTETQVDESTINYSRTTNAGGSGAITLGLNGVAGFDYYFAQNLYLGAEFGFGFSYQSLLAQNTSSDADGFEAPDPIKQGGSFNLGPNVNGQFRLGFLF